jgi:decaprenyl-phosphate phosphoribosyltransferase
MLAVGDIFTRTENSMAIPVTIPQPETAVAANVSFEQRLRAHLRILRLDHSIKQAFILPGIILGIAIAGRHTDLALILRMISGLIAATLISSSNYVLNEMLDAPYDRLHPTKRARPAACGLIHSGLGYAQWIALMLAGLAIAAAISREFLLSALGLWVMGCIYNIPPIRSKDQPYIDVLSESVNNPLRFLLGWYMVTALAPPISLLLSYWMLGAYFMALKRFSEFRQINDHAVAGSYRRSFRFYSQESLLNSVAFYASAAMLFFGAFIMRYRMELILAFPIVAWLMAIYFGLSFRDESPVQNPEKLYREPRLMLVLLLGVAAFTLLLFVNLPWLHAWFPKSQP